jgi:hypothetical protein
MSSQSFWFLHHFWRVSSLDVISELTFLFSQYLDYFWPVEFLVRNPLSFELFPLQVSWLVFHALFKVCSIYCSEVRIWCVLEYIYLEFSCLYYAQFIQFDVQWLLSTLKHFHPFFIMFPIIPICDSLFLGTPKVLCHIPPITKLYSYHFWKCLSFLLFKWGNFCLHIQWYINLCFAFSCSVHPLQLFAYLIIVLFK